MSDTVIVYVTRDGHSRALAEELGRLVGAPAAEIGDEVKRRGFFGYMRSGFQAAARKATPIRDPGVELSRAKRVVLVQPVWASAVCPPLRTWLRAHRPELAGKRIGLVASEKGSPPEKLKLAYETEFGDLAAFACLRKSEAGAAKSAALAAFARELGA